jgi:glycosyltransferase involved in cell wall biosynthesis
LRYLSDIGETETKAIITPSQFEKELVFREIRRFEKTGIPVFVIPNPINLDFFYFKEPKTKLNKKVIGWVGRLEEQKNWNHFLDIASGLSEKRDELLFLIVGGHYADEKIKKKFLSTVKELNLIDCLKWVSYLQYDRMPGVYSLMGASGGCFVATSTLESFGMTVIEAMACRCPVVASRIGSIEEIIEEGKNGLLFELNNSRDAVAKIESLIDNTSEKERLIKSGWVGVTETYSPVRVIDKYIEVLKELAE